MLLPELVILAADHDPVHRHKNLFEHSLAVLDNAVALESHSFLGESATVAHGDHVDYVHGRVPAVGAVDVRVLGVDVVGGAHAAPIIVAAKGGGPR